jgi:hypothetical protein
MSNTPPGLFLTGANRAGAKSRETTSGDAEAGAIGARTKPLAGAWAAISACWRGSKSRMGRAFGGLRSGANCSTNYLGGRGLAVT